MCIGALFGGNKAPAQVAQPIKQTVAPTVKAARPAPQDVTPEKIKEKVDDDELIDTKKKKALEIKKVKEGVGAFSAIDPKSMPQTPAGGVNVP